MSDIYETTTQLASLWPALAAALQRDTAASDNNVTGTHAWTAAVIVNADVLNAIITLGREIPAESRHACGTLGERWQPRDILTSLRAIPRLTSRLDTTGHLREARLLERHAATWLRITKRALGLRKPDIPLGYACPWAETRPEDHADACMLLAAGDEGFLRPGPGGMQVEWVATSRIYCASQDCTAAWGPEQWLHLGRMLTAPAEAAS